MKFLIKTPRNCPFCGGPLRNDYVPVSPKVEYLNLVCDKKTGHTITIRPCHRNTEYIDWISIPLNEKINILWHMDHGLLCLNNKTNGHTENLPFFEPDLSDYRKLIKKVKTYIIFS